jgi:hypothetical protein
MTSGQARIVPCPRCGRPLRYSAATTRLRREGRRRGLPHCFDTHRSGCIFLIPMRRPEDLRVRLSSRAPARGTGSSADARARRPRCRTAPVAPRPEAPRRARGRAPLRWVRIASDFECVNVSDECCPSAVGGRCVQLESARVDARCDVLRATRGGFLGELPLVASPRARASEEQASTQGVCPSVAIDRSRPNDVTSRVTKRSC